MIDKVREYIKDYYKDKEINKAELMKLNSTMLTIKEKVVNLADLLKFCTSYLPEDCKYSERLYHVINNIYEKPICPVCNINTCNFNSYSEGYTTTCSRKCGGIISNEKSKQTCLNKYGKEYVLQIEEVKEKRKETLLTRYGVEHYSQTDEYKNKYKQTCLQNHGVENSFQAEHVKHKIKQTSLNRYGTEHPFQNKEIQDKYKETNLEKFGVEHYSQTEEFKEKYKETMLNNYNVEYPLQYEEFKEKAKNTCTERYGVEYYTQTEEYKEKSKQTCMLNHGVEYPFQSIDIQNKSKQTCLNRYGVDNPLKNIQIQDKCKNTNLENYGVEYVARNLHIKEKALHTYKLNKFNTLLLDTKRLNNCIPLFTFEEFKNNKMKSTYKWRWKCNICDTVFHDDLDNGASPICPKCYKRYGSNLQKEVYDFIYNYTNNILINDRFLGFEIDLYLKDYSLGIEVNGNYWHSDLHGKDKYYHLNKTLECAKNNITLLHIFEDDWLYRKDIVKNLILDKLGLITNTASNLNISEINQDIAAEFLNNSCILGNIKDNTNIIHYGLCDLNNIYYLISVDIVNSKIIRYCSKLNYKVGNDDINKLISYICQENNLDNLTVYCDLRYDSGELFKSIGFNYLKFKQPTYEFIHIKDYNIKIDKENLIFESYDDKLSIWYNAMNNNYDRIWNCGYIIYSM